MPADQYKKCMQRKKAYIDSRIEEANIDKGIIVLLTGNGKGKSSSSLGMVCRALGYDMKVGIAKFLKGMQDTGEDAFLAKQPNVQTAFMKTGLLGIRKIRNTTQLWLLKLGIRPNNI